MSLYGHVIVTCFSVPVLEGSIVELRLFGPVLVGAGGGVLVVLDSLPRFGGLVLDSFQAGHLTEVFGALLPPPVTWRQQAWQSGVVVTEY